MKTCSIRISDSKNNTLDVELSDILEEIYDSANLNWSILFLDGTPNPGQGKFLAEYIKKINRSENGLCLSFEELKNLSDKFSQIFETIVIGAYNGNLLHRYQQEKDMRATCDVVIELIDCAFWEIHVKDVKVIERIKDKFKEIELINSET